LQILKESNLQPKTLIPSIFAIPPDWHICLQDNIAIVRTSKYDGFACDVHNLSAYLSLALLKKESACLYLHRFSENSIELNVIPVTEVPSEKNFLYLMHATLNEHPYINLLQGKYALKEKIKLIKNSWALAGIVMLSWILILFVSHLSSYFILQKEMTQLDTEITQIYKRNFPKATAVVAPRDRMTSELKKLSGNSEKNTILLWLANIAKGLQAVPELQIQHIDYRDKHLMLTVFSKNFADLDNFSKALTMDGLKVKQQSATMTGSLVKATLNIQKDNL
jgi:type II secretion system protein L